VDALPVGEATRLESYQAFVLASAVYYGAWMSDAVELVRTNAALLAERPTWLLSSGPIGTSAPVEPKEVASLREAVHPRDHRIFYGSLDRRVLSVGERLVVGVLKAPEGDFRDWAAIDAYGDDIAVALPSAVAVESR
jgi:menaquinone-dependent protoporphyrinogen oxidase